MNGEFFYQRLSRDSWILILVISALLLSSSCRKTEEPSLIRFIDILGRENIVDTPLFDLAADPEGFSRSNPSLAAIAEKYPLLDLGAGKNPLLIKKKIVMGPLEENVLLAPPRSLFRFKVMVPKGSALEFAYGIYWAKDPARKSKGRRDVEFLVRAQTRGREDLLFRRKMTLMADHNLVYNHKKIDLSPLAGQKVTLEFITRGDQDSLALWFNPIIFKPQPEPRNVILISLDTLRADHLGCYGYSRATSPNMDKLAADSVLFRNTFAPAPWTLPSHMSMLTGLDCINHQVYRVTDRLDPTIPTLADFFRRRSFITGAFTGGVLVRGLFGFSNGFDSFRIHGVISPEHQATNLAQSAIPWIEENFEKNFFLFLHTYQIHDPYATPEPFDTQFLDPGAELHSINLLAYLHHNRDRFKPPVSEAWRRNIVGLYDAEVRYTDEALIAPLVAQLKKLGLYDRTMIVITADHGEEFYEHGGWLHTHSIHQELIRVPLLVKFPGSRDAGKRVERYARLTDIMPTILKEMSVDFSPKDLDGKNLGPLIEGAETGPQRPVRCELAGIITNHVPRKRSVTRDTYRVISNDAYTPQDLAYFAFPPPPLVPLEIYDLSADPGEAKNLVLNRPDLARELLKYLEDSFKPRRKTVGGTALLTPEIKEELKALGYIR